MDLKDQMDDIYRNMSPETIPWNFEKTPEILQRIVETGRIKPCKSIELGCGIGNYVIYLAQKGFDATGVDFSESAIKLAKDTALQKNVDCNFFVSDVLGEMNEIQDSFDFVYDWELLHHIFPEDREKYFINVHRLLNSGSQYMSVCFSDQSPQFGGKGKYRETPLGTTLYFSSESEIISLANPLFQILELETVEIEGKFAPHKAVYSLLRKR